MLRERHFRSLLYICVHINLARRLSPLSTEIARARPKKETAKSEEGEAARGITAKSIYMHVRNWKNEI